MPTASGTALVVAAESKAMIWNAVAIDGERIFVAGPRWSGSKGPAVARVESNGPPRPYPDARWNGWEPGAATTNAFVSVNALHRDDYGGLWIVDTGTLDFGGDPLPRAAKVVRIDLASNEVDRIYPLRPDIAMAGSYIDDIRFHGEHGYLTDAGRAGIVVLDLKSGKARRVLDGAKAVTAPPDRPIVADGRVVRAPDGSALKVNSDPLEVSPDGRYLYFGSLHGPWSRVETRYLDDPSITADELLSHVEPWADLPPVGGTAMAGDGTLYFTELATDSLKRRSPSGTISTVVHDKRLHWGDAPAIADGWIWLPVPQLDRAPIFNSGVSGIEWPIELLKYPLSSSR